MKHGIVRIGTAFYFNLEKALGTTKYPKGHETDPEEQSGGKLTTRHFHRDLIRRQHVVFSVFRLSAIRGNSECSRFGSAFSDPAGGI